MFNGIFNNKCPKCCSSNIKLKSSVRDKLVFTGEEVICNEYQCMYCDHEFFTNDYMDSDKGVECYDDRITWGSRL